MFKSLEAGEEIEVSWKGINISGKFISRDEKITVIKLKNGYNLSLNNSNLKILEPSQTQQRMGNYPRTSANKKKGFLHSTGEENK